MATVISRSTENHGAAHVESDKPAAASEQHQSWIGELYDSGLGLAKDSFKLAATGGDELLHDLHITNGPGAEAYHFSNFVHDHRTAVNYGIDAAAAVAGGATFVATSPFIGPGGILAGAGAGAGVETGLHYLIGDEVTGRQAIKGAALGAGAALGITLEQAVAARFGTSIAEFAGRTVGEFAPSWESFTTRAIIGTGRTGMTPLGAIAADRIRASAYSNLATRSLRLVTQETEQWAGMPH